MIQNGKKITIDKILSKKNIEPITMITAYDALFAKIFDEFVDMILVGDSLNMSFNARPDTLSVTMDEMLYHTKAVLNGAKSAFVVADMPFGSYQNSEKALKNATKFIKIGADAVKLEGGIKLAPTIQRLTAEGINTIAHIGLMPQFVRSEGGYKIKGRNLDDEKRLLDEALALQDAGAFIVLLEGVISEVAKKITQSIKVPTIGIGSGVCTDGQVLVWSDMLGFFDEFKPKFVKRYLNGAELVRNAVREYANDVKERKFPSREFEYKIKNG